VFTGKAAPDASPEAGGRPRSAPQRSDAVAVSRRRASEAPEGGGESSAAKGCEEAGWTPENTRDGVGVPPEARILQDLYKSGLISADKYQRFLRMGVSKVAEPPAAAAPGEATSKGSSTPPLPRAPSKPVASVPASARTPRTNRQRNEASLGRDTKTDRGDDRRRASADQGMPSLRGEVEQSARDDGRPRANQDRAESSNAPGPSETDSPSKIRDGPGPDSSGAEATPKAPPGRPTSSTAARNRTRKENEETEPSSSKGPWSASGRQPGSRKERSPPADNRSPRLDGMSPVLSTRGKKAMLPDDDRNGKDDDYEDLSDWPVAELPDYDEHLSMQAFLQWGKSYVEEGRRLEDSGPAYVDATATPECPTCASDPRYMVGDGRAQYSTYCGPDPAVYGGPRDRRRGRTRSPAPDDDDAVPARRAVPNPSKQGNKIHSAQCTFTVFHQELTDRFRELRFDAQGVCFRTPGNPSAVVPSGLSDVVAYWKKQNRKVEVANTQTGKASSKA